MPELMSGKITSRLLNRLCEPNVVPGVPPMQPTLPGGRKTLGGNIQNRAFAAVGITLHEQHNLPVVMALSWVEEAAN